MWIWLQNGFGCRMDLAAFCRQIPVGSVLQIQLGFGCREQPNPSSKKKKSQLRGMGGTTTGMLDLTCTRSLQPFTARKAAS